ncbi:hypothetical protein PG990_014932 [Apiospora arundinis]
MPSISGETPEWCPEFDQARELLKGYRQVYIKTISDINPKTDDITLFTNRDDPNQTPNKPAETISGFCRFVRSEKAFKLKATDRLVAIVHDCDSAGNFREPRSPVTATKLHEALLRPRFKPDRRAYGAAGRSCATEPLHSEKKQEKAIPDTSTNKITEAERRLVFIVNPDECVVWALATTVSPIQVKAMRTFISNHITFKASFDVSITDRPLTYALSFHLPYYALRDTPKSARFRDFRGLRNADDVEFLRTPSQTDADSSPLCKRIHQAKLSCLVTGQDLHTWDAYMFLDNYNEYEDGDIDIEEDLDPEKEALDRARVTLDPFSGMPLAWPNITPREYFLNVLEGFSTQANNEWANTVSQIMSDFDATRDMYIESLYDQGDEGRNRRHEYSRWTNSVIHLLAKLKRSLDQCVNAWACFAAPDGGFCNFRNMTERNQRQAIVIMKNFKNMSGLLRELEVVECELMNTTTELGHLLSHESNEMANLQSAAAKDVKILTWVTFHSLPFTLGAAFMSTRAGFLPVPETPAALVVCLLAIQAVIWAVLDRVFKGRYVAMVKQFVKAMYTAARHGVRDKRNREGAIEA